jgi:hypothetical protein
VIPQQLIHLNLCFATSLQTNHYSHCLLSKGCQTEVILQQLIYLNLCFATSTNQNTTEFQKELLQAGFCFSPTPVDLRSLME